MMGSGAIVKILPMGSVIQCEHIYVDLKMLFTNVFYLKPKKK